MRLNTTLFAPLLLAAGCMVRAEAPAAGPTTAPTPAATASVPTQAAAPAGTTAAAAATSATKATTIAAATDTSVSIKNFAFAPTATTVTVGTTVRWKNLDGEPHTVRSVDSSFRSDPLDQNDSYSVKFDKPGTYKYVCSIHPQMVGTIVVKAAN
jgi:plastocyanin